MLHSRVSAVEYLSFRRRVWQLLIPCRLVGCIELVLVMPDTVMCTIGLALQKYAMLWWVSHSNAAVQLGTHHCKINLLYITVHTCVLQHVQVNHTLTCSLHYVILLASLHLLVCLLLRTVLHACYESSYKLESSCKLEHVQLYAAKVHG